MMGSDEALLDAAKGSLRGWRLHQVRHQVQGLVRESRNHVTVTVKLPFNAFHLELTFRLHKPKSRILRPKGGQLHMGRVSRGRRHAPTAGAAISTGSAMCSVRSPV